MSSTVSTANMILQTGSPGTSRPRLPHVEHLPPEIQVLFMLALDSTKSLLSLIGASPRFFQVYLTQKRQILEANAFDRGILNDASAVINVQTLMSGATVRGIGNDMSFPNWNERDAYAARESRRFFDEHYPVEDTARFITHPALDNKIEISRLSNLIDFFIEDLTRQQLPRLDKYARLSARMSEGEWSKISKERGRCGVSHIERTRLQRAFLKFEVCSHLFHVQKARMPSLGENAILRLLSRWPPWELEELRSVQAYLNTRLREIFRKIENNFVDFEYNRVRKEREETAESNPYILAHDLRFFSRQCKVERHAVIIEYLTSLGLDFLRTLFKATTRGQGTIIRHSAYGSVPFLSGALESSLKSVREDWHANEEDRNFKKDDVKRRNLGWVLAQEDPVPEKYYVTKSGRELSSWGYVFWDAPRLRAFEMTIHSKYTLPQKKGDRHTVTAIRRPVSAILSAEERVCDLIAHANPTSMVGQQGTPNRIFKRESFEKTRMRDCVELENEYIYDDLMKDYNRTDNWDL